MSRREHAPAAPRTTPPAPAWRYARGMTFVPHAILVAIAYLWLEGVFLPGSEIAFAVTAAVLPFWAMWVGRRHSVLRALLLGPGTAVLGAAAVLVWSLLDPDRAPIGELDWLLVLVAIAALVLYALYCAVAFAVAAWI